MQLRRFHFLLLLVTLTSIFGYQNCGDIRLASNLTDQASIGAVEGSFCSSLRANDPATLLSFHVVNMTARVNRLTGALESDSDMDGLPDIVEDNEPYKSLGYSSTKRRSLGGILDRMCSEQGSVQCQGSGDMTVVTPGFVASDLSTYNFGTGSIPGINSDNDLIPDFVEYLFELDLTRSDDSNFSDGDSMSLAEELKRGRSPVSPNDGFLGGGGYQYSRYFPDASVPCPAGQTGYRFSISEMTLVPTKAFTSEEEPLLNHDVNINLIGVFLLSVNGANEKELQVGLLPLYVQRPTGTLTPDQFSGYK